MKILHTSDWHLGHVLYGRDRLTPQLAMLVQLEKIIRQQTPDVLIISGDIYHTGQPSAQVQRMFADALMAYNEAVPEMQIVVIAGNHDSASKLDIYERPWKKANVNMVSYLDSNSLENLIIELPGKGYVIAVPYTSMRNMPEDVFSRLCEMVGERNSNSLPVVLAAHLTVQGCDFTGHDNATDRSIGGIDAIKISSLGSGYDYAALGHIHHPQTIGEEGRVRYAGTPLPVSFDERFTHTVSIVEISAHGDTPNLSEIEIENTIPLVTLPEEGYAEWDDVIAMLKEFPADKKAYLRLNVQTDGFLPVDAREQASAVTSDKECEVLTFNSRMNDAVERAESEKELTADELQKIDPIEIARGLLAEGDFDSELEDMFKEVVRIVTEEQKEED